MRTIANRAKEVETMNTTNPIKRVGVLAALHKPNIEMALQRVLRVLDAWGVQVMLPTECAEFIRRPTAATHPDDIATADLILALGGDGCVLSAARMTAQHNTAILGVRVGGFGFLSEVDWHNVEEALTLIQDGKHSIEKRWLVEALVQRDGQPIWMAYALNDVVVTHSASPRLHMFEVRVNGEMLLEVFADGIIVATPTGSTAYSLSAGGPIVLPDANVFLITPVCAHVLYARPVVTSADAVVSVRVPPTKMGDVDATVMVDGQVNLRLLPEDEVLVKTSTHYAHLVRLGKFQFLERLRQKLKWGYRD
ncbi:MAG TPA: NAD(+)/NADH kinase [Armatimonadetes bacterium]|nr:NAD(+)/NADH kinase [Armatimonadota bacterium]